MLELSLVSSPRGLGKLLLRAAEEFGNERWGCLNAEMTVISVRVELIAWYRRRGHEIRA